MDKRRGTKEMDKRRWKKAEYKTRWIKEDCKRNGTNEYEKTKKDERKWTNKNWTKED